MGRVLTNNVQLSYSVEASLGVLAGSPVWYLLEPNSIKKYGADIKTTERNPISALRQRRKGTVTDLNSDVEVDMDLTMEHFHDFIEGFCYSAFKGSTPDSPSAVTTTQYTIPAHAALAANTLVYARGFTNSGNNGLKVVGSSSTTTAIKVSSLITEASPPTNAIVEVCGVRGAAGDFQIDSSGNLIDTTLDFTTLGLYVGQAIWIGGDVAANQFFGTTNKGYARISAIAAHKITLNKRSAVYTTDDGTSTGSGGTPKLIDIFFGNFVRNVAGNDANYAEKTFQFELYYPNLQNPGPGDMYEYSSGNYCDTLTFDLPLASKAMLTATFVGQNTANPTTSRATNAATPISVLKSTAFNTSADLARLRMTNVDETGLTTDFKTLKMEIKNNVSGEKVIGTLGPKYLNVGILDLNITADLIFTNSAVIDALRNNTTVTMDFAIRNADGAILVDVPSMSIATGVRNFPVNQSVLLQTTAVAYKDDTLSTSLGITVFPYVPAA